MHDHDLTRVYCRCSWTLHDFMRVLMDWLLWLLVFMYFGVVDIGIGVQYYSTVIISATNPRLTGIHLSLLFAPIRIMDLIAILLVTQLSDRSTVPPTSTRTSRAGFNPICPSTSYPREQVPTVRRPNSKKSPINLSLLKIRVSDSEVRSLKFPPFSAPFFGRSGRNCRCTF
jgi:hypothetical protein